MPGNFPPPRNSFVTLAMTHFPLLKYKKIHYHCRVLVRLNKMKRERCLTWYAVNVAVCDQRCLPPTPPSGPLCCHECTFTSLCTQSSFISPRHEWLCAKQQYTKCLSHCCSRSFSQNPWREESFSPFYSWGAEAQKSETIFLRAHS